MKRLLTCLCGLLLACNSTVLAAVHTVTTTGDGEAATLDEAKDRALADARRNASEQVGVLVKSETRVADGAVASDTVSTMTAAFLRLRGVPRYEITQQDDKVTAVRATITADVDDSDLQHFRQLLRDQARVAEFQRLTHVYQHLQQEAMALRALLGQARTPQDKAKYTQALERNAVLRRSYQLLQQAYATVDNTAARDLLQQAVALYPDNAAAYAALAGICMDESQLAASLQYVDAGLAALPRANEYTDDDKQTLQFILLCLRGNTHFLNGQYVEALAAFQEAEPLSSEIKVEQVRKTIYAHFLFDYGGLQMIQGEYVQSAQLLERLMALLEPTSTTEPMATGAPAAPATDTMPTNTANTSTPPTNADGATITKNDATGTAQPADELQGDAYMLATSYAYYGIDLQAQGKLKESEAAFARAKALATQLSPAAAVNIQTLLDNYAHIMH